MYSRRFYIALVIAVIYMVVAAALVRSDRVSNTGGFINLQGLLSALTVIPLSFPLEYSGHKMDYRSNLQMGAAIVFCGVLVFGVAYGTMSAVSAITSQPVRK